MSYSKQYGKCRYEINRKRGNPTPIFLAIGLVTMIILLYSYFPRQIDRLRQTAFPFFSDSVQDSLSAMAQQMREGEPFENAARAFCENIFQKNTN